MRLEIITPETKVFEGEVTAVQLPGKDGLFQVLNNHSPIISTLTEGTVKIDLVEAIEAKKVSKLNKLIQVDGSNKIIRVDVKGGVIEMLNNKLIILAE